MAQGWLTDDQQRIWRNYLAVVSRLEAAMNRQLQQDCGLSLPDYEVLVALSICATTDPDGWKVVFVDEADFLEELK